MLKVVLDDTDFHFSIPDTWIAALDEEVPDKVMFRIMNTEKEISGTTIHLIGELEEDEFVDLSVTLRNAMDERGKFSEIVELNKNTVFSEFPIEEPEGKMWMKRWLTVRSYYLVEVIYTCYLNNIEDESTILEEIVRSICAEPSELN